jgi:hypothetical protein
MATGPNHKWLGIPEDEQPPNHYRLLSVPQFEPDADVIEGAAERQTVYLRTFQTGPDAELAERLLQLRHDALDHRPVDIRQPEVSP